MTGWIIFGVVVLLLSLPFFVPITLRLGLDAKRRDWSVQLGTLQVAPDTETHLAAFRQRWSRRTKPLRTLFRWLWLGLKTVARTLLQLLSILSWPLRMVFRLTRRTPKSSEAGPLNGPRDEMVGEQPDESIAESTRNEDDELPRKGTIRRDPPPGFIHTDPGDKTDDGGAEEPGSSRSKQADEPGLGTGSTAEGGEGKSAAKRKSKLKSLLIRVRTTWAYVTDYGPLAKRIFRAALLFVGECLAAIRFKRFDGRYGFGGDPAALGAWLGWHNALVASINPQLPRHIQFEPEFEDEEAEAWGSLDAVVVIWPYRFVPPILRLIIRIPWIRVVRAVRTIQKGESGRDDAPIPSSTGVAA